MDFDIRYRGMIKKDGAKEYHAHDFWDMLRHLRLHVDSIGLPAFQPIIDATVRARLYLGDVCAFELSYSEALRLAQELCDGDPRVTFYSGTPEHVAQTFMARAQHVPR